MHPGPPPYLGRSDWCSVTEAAEVFGRHVRTIRLWLLDGTFAEFGIKTYQDPTGVWHINVPPKQRRQKTAAQGLTP